MTERIYDNFEDELDAIRIGIYEEIKDMTPEERVMGALENGMGELYGY